MKYVVQVTATACKYFNSELRYLYFMHSDFVKKNLKFIIMTLLLMHNSITKSTGTYLKIFLQYAVTFEPYFFSTFSMCF